MPATAGQRFETFSALRRYRSEASCRRFQSFAGFKLPLDRGPWIAALAGLAFVSRAVASLICIGMGILLIYLGWAGN